MEKLEDKSSESGMSLLETLPLIIVISSLIGFMLGFWGMVHKNILNSIAARNYAFETFRNRSNLTYFSDVSGLKDSYAQSNMRFHAIGSSSSVGEIKAHATPFRFPASKTVQAGNADLHGQRIWESIQKGVEVPEGLSPNLTHSWVMVGYGICLNAICEGN